MAGEDNREDNQQVGGRSSRQPLFLLPASISILCGALIAVHIAKSFILNDSGEGALILWFAFIPYRLFDPAQVDGGWLPMLWTPFTHAFLHAGWEHLLVNVAWLAIFGSPVARRYGGGVMLILFLVSAFAGAAFFAATTWGDVQILIGASGGIAGLTGAAVRFIFQPMIVAKDPETGETRVLGRHLASFGELIRHPTARFFTLIWLVLNAAVPFLPLLMGSGAVQVAWQAHLGGFIIGLLLVPLFERRDRSEA